MKKEEGGVISRNLDKVKRKIKDFFYGISVKIYENKKRRNEVKHKVEKVGTFKTKRRGEIIFITSMMIYPWICWLINYLANTATSVILAFQTYDPTTNSYYISGFNNIARFLNEVVHDPLMSKSLINSVILYLVGLVAMPIHILVSFTIYKKIPGWQAWRIILFLPSIVSSIVWVLIYRYFIEYALPVLINQPDMTSLFVNEGTVFMTLLIYSQWLGFAGGLVLYTGAMSRIPVSLVEYGKLEGLTAMKEFYHITLPLIYPTLSVMLTTGVMGIFTSQLPAYAFFQSEAPSAVYSFGYIFFIKVFGDNASVAEYPYSAASSLVFTAVGFPLTLIVKNLLEKYGPNVEF